MTIADPRVRFWFEQEGDKPLIYFSGQSVARARGSRMVGSRLAAIRKLYDDGLVELAQRRIPGKDEFDYLAQKRVAPIRIPPEFTFRAHELVE